MTAQFKPRNPVTKAQYPKFFSMLRKAALNLSLDTPQEVEEYRHPCENLLRREHRRQQLLDGCHARRDADN